MKQLILCAAITACGVFSMNAQTEEGNWLIEVNTGFPGGALFGQLGHTSNTGFGLISSDGETIWTIGAEGGYFVMDDLAIKVGLGYADLSGDLTMLTYKIGAKYYFGGMVPVQLDVTGSSIKDANDNPLWLGAQAGYAIFIGDNVSIEPGLRYALSLNKDYTDEGVFGGRIGFTLHF